MLPGVYACELPLIRYSVVAGLVISNVNSQHIAGGTVQHLGRGRAEKNLPARVAMTADHDRLRVELLRQISNLGCGRAKQGVHLTLVDLEAHCYFL